MRGAKLRDAIRRADFAGAPIQLGWDTAHIEWRGIPLVAARMGKRPRSL